jgi:hypothetical protein
MAYMLRNPDGTYDVMDAQGDNDFYCLAKNVTKQEASLLVKGEKSPLASKAIAERGKELEADAEQTSIAFTEAQVTDKRLMTDADYGTFLLQVETALPKWETALKNIAPENDPRISYSLGKTIMDGRNLGLMQVGSIRAHVAKQQVKRTVLGELGLSGFLQCLYNVVGDEVQLLEDAGGLTLSSLENYFPELSALSVRIGNDVLARLALLEKGTCL